MTALVRKDEKNPKIFRESVNGGFEGRNEIRDTRIKDGADKTESNKSRLSGRRWNEKKPA